MTKEQQVALDAMRSAWPEETVTMMLRGADGRQQRALAALGVALGHGNAAGHYWAARQFIRECGGYDGDLSGEAVLGEVVRLALSPSEKPQEAPRVRRPMCRCGEYMDAHGPEHPPVEMREE